VVDQVLAHYSLVANSLFIIMDVDRNITDRISLSFHPTPITNIQRLSLPKPVLLSIKRDDVNDTLLYVEK
jgi:hypothetical protein